MSTAGIHAGAAGSAAPRSRKQFATLRASLFATAQRHGPDFQRPVVCLLGLPFDAIGMDQASRRICHAAQFRQPCFLSTPNLNFVIGSLSDPAFRNSVIGSDLSIVDGMPLVWIARLLGLPIRERLAGSDLFEFLCRQPGKPLAVYLFGGQPGAAARASLNLNQACGGVHCVGFEYPGFGDIEYMSDHETIARINDSDADLLVVALGARKGQAWIERNRERLKVPVKTHLGAVLNHVAGTLHRAPVWMRRCGLEWLWRIKEEPSLWRRYASDGAVLLRLLLFRVAPGILYRWLLPPRRAALDRARMSALRDADHLHFTFCGAWRGENLGQVRKAFDHAVRKPGSISLDLAEAEHIDHAFIALLMLLHGHQTRLGLPFAISDASARVRRELKFACAEFLLRPAPRETRRQRVGRPLQDT